MERAKKAEELVFSYGVETGARTVVYRFPNLFGKWCRPNYNSVVATFCHNIAHELPIRVDDPETELELAYIDDVVEELLLALQGREHRQELYAFVPDTHRVRLGEIACLLKQFHDQPRTLLLPDIPEGSFATNKWKAQ